MHDHTRTARLRQVGPPLGIGPNEAVCDRCDLVYNVDGVTWGLCPECFTELIASKGDYA